jgi:hypothetical protein
MEHFTESGQHDDFKAWVADHEKRGYVICWDNDPNNLAGTRLHAASCGMLNHAVVDPPNYTKSCSTRLVDLADYWRDKHGGVRLGQACEVNGDCHLLAKRLEHI